MKPRWNAFCSCLVVACFLFATVYPADTLAFFDEDALKTTGIIMGITAGVALLVILVIGVVRDMKEDRDEDEDVWSQSPVLRTLGYNPGAFPYLPGAPAKSGTLCGTVPTRDREIGLFLQAEGDASSCRKATSELAPDSSGFTSGTGPTGFSLSHPEPGPKGEPLPFSFWEACNRSCTAEGRRNPISAVAGGSGSLSRKEAEQVTGRQA